MFVLNAFFATAQSCQNLIWIFYVILLTWFEKINTKQICELFFYLQKKMTLKFQSQLF